MKVWSANGTTTPDLGLASQDSALVSIGAAEALPSLRAPDVAGGVHFALTGNVRNWEQNTISWARSIFVARERKRCAAGKQYVR